MGSSNDGLPAAQGAQDPTEGGQRGFFGRLLSVLSPPETPAEAAPTGTSPDQHPGIGNLRRLRVDDVAIPKSEIVAVPDDIGRDDLVAVFREHGFSRVVVYKGSLDTPAGLVLLKDFALKHGFGGDAEYALAPLLRPVLYAPPSMPIGVLLRQMQKDRVHMALVIDEYGGVDGLVTIEDLIETVIGEIEDEHDEDEDTPWLTEAPGVWLIQGRAPLEDVEAATGLRLRADEDDEDIDTIGGLIFLRTGRVPALGEVVAHESGATFEMVDVDPRRINRLRLRLPAATAD